MRFCIAPNCDQPVFGTCKITREGYCKRHQSMRKDFDSRSIVQKAMAKQKTHKPTTSLKSSVRGLVDKNIGKDKVIGSKSELLRMADKAFADFIKRRDVKNGKYTCPCCNKEWDADKVDSDGNKVLNCGHFCDRDIYSLRFDEDNAAAIDTYCNKKMHYSPDGIEYQNFRKHLVGKFGELSVAEMELQKRKINKLDVSTLKNVIEHYQN